MDAGFDPRHRRREPERWGSRFSIQTWLGHFVGRYCTEIKKLQLIFSRRLPSVPLSDDWTGFFSIVLPVRKASRASGQETSAARARASDRNRRLEDESFFGAWCDSCYARATVSQADRTADRRRKRPGGDVHSGAGSDSPICHEKGARPGSNKVRALLSSRGVAVGYAERTRRRQVQLRAWNRRRSGTAGSYLHGRSTLRDLRRWKVRSEYARGLRWLGRGPPAGQAW